MDERLRLAQLLDREADRDWELIDVLTEGCRVKRAQARRLREEVAAELEAQAHQRAADAELIQRPGRKVGVG